MAAPIVASVLPVTGLTRGETFVVITGTGFLPPVPRLNSEPPTGPFTRVFFDGVEALETAVISSILIHALTPRLAQSFPVILPANVDVRVENVTPTPPGADVVEPVTVTNGFQYRRPDLQTKRDHTTDPEVLIVVRQLLMDFRTHVLANTHHDTHPEYADAASALNAEEKQASVPHLKILGPVIQEERGSYAENGEMNQQVTPAPGIFETFSQRVTVTLTFQYVGVGRTFGEASQLWSAVTDYLNRTPKLELPQDGVDKANGVVEFELAPVWEERAEFSNRATRQGIYQFEGSMVVRGLHIGADKVREGRDVLDGVTIVTQAIPRTAVPEIDPLTGSTGAFFTITDPDGRLEVGDLALFYVAGLEPVATGVSATGVAVTPDGTMLTGFVPVTAAGDKLISVRGPAEPLSRFKPDLAFTVTP